MESTRTASPAAGSGQLDIRSVSACVAAVVTAYVDAAKLVERIKTSKQEQDSTADPALTSFEQSLSLGAPVVRGQYSKDLERYGDTYADGDQTARENLKDIVINLQLSLLATLRMALLDNEGLDCASLQAASDSSRVDAVLCLSQLGDRMAHRRPSTSAAANSRTATPTALLGAPTQQITDTTTTTSPEPPANNNTSPPPAPQNKTPPPQEDTLSGGNVNVVRSPNSRASSALENRKNSDSKPPSFAQQDRKSSHDSKPASLALKDRKNSNDSKPASFAQENRKNSHDSKPTSPPPNRSSRDAFSPGSTDLVPQPLATTNTNGSSSHSNNSLNKRFAPNHRRIHNGSYQSSFISRRQSSQPTPRQSVDTTQEEPSNPHHFIAELEGPLPPPRPRSERAEDELSSQQPEGNSVFISADISSLIGPGPNPFETEDLDLAEKDEKPLPPDPSAGRTMGMPYSQYPVTTVISSNTTATSGSNNAHAHAQAPGGGMFSGLKGRAKRFTAVNPVSQGKPAPSKASDPKQQQDTSKAGRHRAIPKGLKFSGLKWGRGVNSNSNNSNNNQLHPEFSSQDTDRPHTSSGQMSHPTDGNSAMYLPSEDNHYAGFCKGAWKLQSGIQKAFVLEYRPVGAHGQGHMWRCTKCTFEVPPDFQQQQQQPLSPPQRQDTNTTTHSSSTARTPSGSSPWTTHPARQIIAHHHGRTANPPQPMGSPQPPPDSSTSTSTPPPHSTNASSASTSSPGQGVSTTSFDQAMHVHPGTGIRYRWLFLAKSHVHTKSLHTSGVSGVVGSFGCIFCCIAQRGSAPIFGNVHAFMEHLTVHAADEGVMADSGGSVPSREILDRTKCIVGRVAQEQEDFELNIPPRNTDAS